MFAEIDKGLESWIGRGEGTGQIKESSWFPIEKDRWRTLLMDNNTCCWHGSEAFMTIFFLCLCVCGCACVVVCVCVCVCVSVWVRLCEMGECVSTAKWLRCFISVA